MEGRYDEGMMYIVFVVGVMGGARVNFFPCLQPATGREVPQVHTPSIHEIPQAK